jgi:DNA-binding CsgD family transcriptional regulator
MYAALAGVVVDAERRLWHLAMSTSGPDDEIALALDDHSTRARRRGAVTVAAAALERAAMLTSDPQLKGDRLVRAAEIAYEMGQIEIVSPLLAEARELDLGFFAAARLEWLGQMLSGDVWLAPGITKTFVRIAERIRDGGDADMALRSLVPIAHRSWWTQTQPRTRQFLVDTARGIGVPDDDARLLAVVALADPERVGPEVRRRISGIRRHEVADPLDAVYLGIAAEKAGDFVAGTALLARGIERLREQGRLGVLTQALVHYGWSAIHVGDWAATAAASSEASSLARDTNQPQFGLTAEIQSAFIEALQGVDPDVASRLAQSERTLRAMKNHPLLATAHLARGADALGDGRHGEAFRHLWPVFDTSAPAFHRFMQWPAILDLVEAGVGCGQTDRLGRVVDALEETAAHSKPPILCIALLCARPLLTDRNTERMFKAALGQDTRDFPFQRARTLFSYGRWLRRQRRTTESREPLRSAIELFEALGATRWAHRAQQELRAAGEASGIPADADNLTAQELQIARLAAEGLSNREIGERLFLSHRTIGSHLYRIFPKLEVTARSQLRDALVDIGSHRDPRR